MSPGRSESPGVTSDLLAAARRSASQPMKARAITMTMKILRKVFIHAFRSIRPLVTRPDGPWFTWTPAGLLHHAAWNVGCWQLPFTNDLGADFHVPRSKSAKLREEADPGNTARELRALDLRSIAGLWDFLIFPGPRNPVPAILIGGGVPVWAMRADAGDSTKPARMGWNFDVWITIHALRICALRQHRSP